jgi:hypothetical protein
MYFIKTRKFLIAVLVLSFLGLCACAAELKQFNVDAHLRVVGSDITPWPQKVQETSGLARRGQVIWTINDSGDKAAIYGLDQQGKVIKKLFIGNGHNTDFEELSQDETYLYVADTGDNWGERKVLTVYRLGWRDIEQAENQQSIRAELINVKLSDRSKFEHKNSHNYDFEAMTVKGNELWLFSKNRLDGKSDLYRLPKTPGDYTVSVSSSYAVNGLITGADIDPSNGLAVLVGYQIHSGSFASFIWTAPSTEKGLDWTRAKSAELQPGGQWEAVMWSEDKNQIIISREDNFQGAVAAARLTLP